LGEVGVEHHLVTPDEVDVPFDGLGGDDGGRAILQPSFDRTA